jgi:universal stress protein E
MRLIERILVATDFSQSADDAVKMASYLAKGFDASVQLIHAMPPLPGVAVSSTLIKEQITNYLDTMRQALLDDGVSTVESVLVSGKPFARIIDCAEEQNANVIVVGSGQNTRNDQYRVGITAQRLERRAQRPVLVVKPGAAPPINHVVCPVDFSQTSAGALRESIHIARGLRAKLCVMTVVQPLKSLLPRFVTVTDEMQQQQVSGHEASFDEFLREFDFHDIEYEKLVCEGQPHEEILRVANEFQADLLVMGSVGRTGVARLLMGSVAEKVARQLPCSILTVKGEDFVRLTLQEEIEDAQEHIQRGEELLDKGFAREALGEFRHCIARDAMYAPAWEGAAAAHERLGNDEEAQRCRERANEIVKQLWDKRIEAEIRSQHVLWRKRGPYTP